jgi:hypothetical protein
LAASSNGICSGIVETTEATAAAFPLPSRFTPCCDGGGEEGLAVRFPSSFPLLLPWLLVLGVRGEGGRVAGGGEAMPLLPPLWEGREGREEGGGERGLLLWLLASDCCAAFSLSFSCEVLDRKLNADMKEEEEEEEEGALPLPPLALLLLLWWGWLPLLMVLLLLLLLLLPPPPAPAVFWVMPWCWRGGEER